MTSSADELGEVSGVNIQSVVGTSLGSWLVWGLRLLKRAFDAAFVQFHQHHDSPMEPEWEWSVLRTEKAFELFEQVLDGRRKIFGIKCPGFAWSIFEFDLEIQAKIKRS